MNLLIIPANDRYRFVCATSKQTSETVYLTSYNSPLGGNDRLNSVKIWEACIATGSIVVEFDLKSLE